MLLSLRSPSGHFRTGAAAACLRGTRRNNGFALLFLVGMVLLAPRLSGKGVPTPPPPQPGDGNTYVISVGINDYDHVAARINDEPWPVLTGCVNDANDLAAAFVKKPLSRGDTKTIIKLTNEQATLPNIIAAFNAIAKVAKPEDVFVFTFSGYMDHVPGPVTPAKGPVKSGRFHSTNGLVVHDTTTDPKTELTPELLTGLLTKIPASQQLLLLDTCSGESGLEPFLHALQGGENAKAERVLMDRRVSVVVPSLSREVSAKNANTTHGQLTDFALEVLTPPENKSQPSSPKDHLSAATVVKYLQYRFAVLADEGKYDDPVKLFVLEDQPVSGGSSAVAATRGAHGDAAPPESTNGKGKDYALLVGCSNYDDKGFVFLPNPVVDVDMLGKTLRDKYHYADVQILKNPTYREVFAAIQAWKSRTYEPGDQLLLYFAGHGDFDKDVGDGYLVFKDSLRDVPPSEAKTFQYSALRGMANNIPCQHVFVVLDACYAGSFDPKVVESLTTTPPGRDGGEKNTDTERDPNEYVRLKMALRSRKMLTSGFHSVSDGNPGEGSPFVRRLLDVLVQRADDKKMLTFNKLIAALEGTKPGPLPGDFGNPAPGGDFVFIP